MADAKLSPRELADLLGKLDDVSRSVQAMRQRLIDAMAARRRPRVRERIGRSEATRRSR